MTGSLRLTDVTLRDGLQSVSQAIPTESKIALYEALRPCGFTRLEITSFVSPKWIPQLADSEAFCKQIFSSKTKTPPELMAFVPNVKGLERLLEFPIQWVSVFIAASETFNKKNINATIEETLGNLKSVIYHAKQNHRLVRVYVSTVFGCPFEGKILEKKLMTLLKAVAALKPDEIALSDTIGVALPTEVEDIVDKFSRAYPVDQTALHLHNTYGLAVANAKAGYRKGIRLFDGSLGGLGGCPYAKGASGNVATEELAYLFERLSHKSQVHWKEIGEALQVLRKTGLSTTSHLSEVFAKGGTLYGIH